MFSILTIFVLVCLKIINTTATITKYAQIYIPENGKVMISNYDPKTKKYDEIKVIPSLNAKNYQLDEETNKHLEKHGLNINTESTYENKKDDQDSNCVEDEDKQKVKKENNVPNILINSSLCCLIGLLLSF